MWINIRKSLSMLLLLLILVSILPWVSVDANSETYYGEAYYDLTTEQQRTAYRLVEEAIAGLSPVVDFNGIVEIYYRDLLDIVRAVCVDHPQYFWFLEDGIYHYDSVFEGNLVNRFEPQYILDGQVVSAGSQELADAMYAFNAKVNEIVAGIPVNYTSEYEIALYLHDYLVDHVSYTLEGDHPSAYAALIHGSAACYGYSKAYQCLLNEAGIRARTITGNSPDENGNLIGHAWNQLWLDGACYYTDVTWDDYETVNLHACFAVPLETISKDHFAQSEFILPDCGHSQLDYHAMYQGSGIVSMTPDTKPEEIAPCFRLDSITEAGAVFSCELRYKPGLFFGWLRNHGQRLYDLLGLSAFTQVYYYQQYDVYYIQLVDVKYSKPQPAVQGISLNVTSVSLPGIGKQVQLTAKITCDNLWTPDLVYESSDPSVARVNEKGLVTAVSEGTAVITARSADGKVSDNCAITVTAAEEHTHKMRTFEAEEPTCTQDGHIRYYLCTLCGLRFADETATTQFVQTSEFVLPATGHVELTWISRFDYHMKQCKCGHSFTNTKADHKDADADKKCDTCGSQIQSAAQLAPNAAQKDASGGRVWPVVFVIVAIAAIVLIFVVRKRRRGY